jgi:hypothetical protein
MVRVMKTCQPLPCTSRRSSFSSIKSMDCKHAPCTPPRVYCSNQPMPCGSGQPGCSTPRTFCSTHQPCGIPQPCGTPRTCANPQACTSLFWLSPPQPCGVAQPCGSQPLCPSRLCTAQSPCSWCKTNSSTNNNCSWLQWRPLPLLPKHTRNGKIYGWG